MLISRLAFKNLLRGGLRTWLNVLVLSIAFMAIIWLQGINDGLQAQASKSMIEARFGGGQYWHSGYDPYDPLSLPDAHDSIPPALQQLIDQQKATPILITQGAIYPEGRIRSVILKGIDPQQTIMNLPTGQLKSSEEELPALIGTRMAKSANLKRGDYLTVRWRDTRGTFDARDLRIVEIMSNADQNVDVGQIWFPLANLQKMTGMSGEATLVIVEDNLTSAPQVSGWRFMDLDFLLKDIRDLIRLREIASFFLFAILMFLAVLTIFDTQVLSIFHRQKEIGTLISLGMTRASVVRLFTLEGGLYGVLAVLVGAMYGLPTCYYLSTYGFPLPQSADSFGIAIGNQLYPVYGAGLITGVMLLVMVVVTLVSYIPAKKIASLRPTDALRGKML